MHSPKNTLYDLNSAVEKLFVCMYFSCDVSPQDQWLPSLWPVPWTSFSVCTPSSASQKAGHVTESQTVLISLMKSNVQLQYLVLFLLKTAVSLSFFSVQTFTASPPYFDVTASQTAPMERTSTAAVSLRVRLCWVQICLEFKYKIVETQCDVMLFYQ